jgi:hypothetical protein
MSIRTPFVATAFALALLAGCGQKEEAAAPAEQAAVATTTSAASTMAAQVSAFRANDLKTLLAAALPPAQLDKLRAEWDAERQQPLSEEERLEFAENWGKLTAPDGIDRIMAEIEPQLVELKPQMAGLIGMGQVLASSAIAQSTDLTAEQKAQATQFMNGLGAWAMKTDFSDPALLRQSLTALAEGLRATGIKTLDDARALTFDELLVRIGQAMGGFKQALAVYGFSLDEMADSVKTELVSENGDSARVKVSYALFGAPMSFESDMERVDGQWYGKDMLEQIRKEEAEAAAGAGAEAEASTGS